MVVCDVVMPIARAANADAESMDWTRESLEYTVRFVSLSGVSPCLQPLHLETILLEQLIDIIQTYDPVQTILLLMNKNGQAEINLLQNLVISTTDCHQQMQRRWSEFQLEPSQQQRPL